MLASEAREMLKTAPLSDKPSRPNPSITQRQFVQIMMDCFADTAKHPDNEIIWDILEKRVYQCCRRQIRPRY